LRTTPARLINQPTGSVKDLTYTLTGVAAGAGASVQGTIDLIRDRNTGTYWGITKNTGNVANTITIDLGKTYWNVQVYVSVDVWANGVTNPCSITFGGTTLLSNNGGTNGQVTYYGTALSTQTIVFSATATGGGGAAYINIYELRVSGSE